MSYVNKTVAVSGDEKTFIKTFIAQLTAADSRITCDDDIDAQFADTSNTPTFNINFGVNSRIVFQRGSKSAFSNCRYDATVQIGNVSIKYVLYYMLNNLSYDAVTTRTWRFCVVSNNSGIYIAFGNHDNVIPNDARFSVMSISDGDFSASATENGPAAIVGSFIGTNTGNIGMVNKFADRLVYAAESGKVEIVKNKALLDSAKTFKIMEFVGLYDCSTMPQSLQLEIDGVKYLTIGNNTLMPID